MKSEGQLMEEGIAERAHGIEHDYIASHDARQQFSSEGDAMAVVIYGRDVGAGWPLVWG